MNILIVRNNYNPKAIEASFTLSAFLSSQNIDSSFVDSSTLYEQDPEDIARDIDIENLDLAVVLGGDGTILRTARMLQFSETPILGINFGNLGFLANNGEMGVIELVSRAFGDELVRDRRANLLIDVFCEGDGEGAKPRSFFALNELAITRGSLGRTISYSLDINDVHIADVDGDGVIVATATGSTAYNLAAGGPIVNPGYNGLVIQPIAPHTLTARAMLTDCNDIVRIDLSKMREGREATLFVDGDLLEFTSPVREVLVRRGSIPTTLLYANKDHFYRYAAQTFFTD